MGGRNFSIKFRGSIFQTPNIFVRVMSPHHTRSDEQAKQFKRFVLIMFIIPKESIIIQTFSTMKLFTTITVALTSSASAFVVGPLHLQASNRPHAALAPLEASRDHQTHWGAAVTGAIVGWTLATQIATAAVVGIPMQDETMDMGRSVNYPTTMLSLGAYQPEDGYASLDLSMPSYKVESISAPKDEPLADPSKQEARSEKYKATEQAKVDKEQELAKKSYEKQKAAYEKKAEKESIKAEVAAGRQAAKEAKLASKQ